MTLTRLPIDHVLPELVAHLRDRGRAVLQAPPGAGKTTRVPLAMLDAGLTVQRIVMLEPRRLAARAAAERMAETLGEAAGQTVGYRVRGEAKVSGRTRIEVRFGEEAPIGNEKAEKLTEKEVELGAVKPEPDGPWVVPRPPVIKPAYFDMTDLWGLLKSVMG